MINYFLHMNANVECSIDCRNILLKMLRLKIFQALYQLAEQDCIFNTMHRIFLQKTLKEKRNRGKNTKTVEKYFKCFFVYLLKCYSQSTFLEEKKKKLLPLNYFIKFSPETLISKSKKYIFVKKM